MGGESIVGMRLMMMQYIQFWPRTITYHEQISSNAIKISLFYLMGLLWMVLLSMDSLMKEIADNSPKRYKLLPSCTISLCELREPFEYP
jgi:hypothetical protein